MLLLPLALPPPPPPPPRVEVVLTQPAPVTGRLVVIVSKTKDPEPRFAVSPSGPAIFGIDLTAEPAGRPIVVDERAIGYPTSLADLPAGDYVIQAVVNVYERAHRADGHDIWVHLNDGRIEFFTNAAGNLY